MCIGPTVCGRVLTLHLACGVVCCPGRTPAWRHTAPCCRRRQQPRLHVVAAGRGCKCQHQEPGTWCTRGHCVPRPWLRQSASVCSLDAAALDHRMARPLSMWLRGTGSRQQWCCCSMPGRKWTRSHGYGRRRAGLELLHVRDCSPVRCLGAPPVPRRAQHRCTPLRSTATWKQSRR